MGMLKDSCLCLFHYSVFQKYVEGLFEPSPLLFDIEKPFERHQVQEHLILAILYHFMGRPLS